MTVKRVTFWNEGLTSSVQVLPVILKWQNFQSLEKALNFCMELKIVSEYDQEIPQSQTDD